MDFNVEQRTKAKRQFLAVAFPREHLLLCISQVVMSTRGPVVKEDLSLVVKRVEKTKTGDDDEKFETDSDRKVG